MPKHKTRKVTRRAKRGGVINKLPIDTPTQLSEWNIFYCASHGSITNLIKVVPKNTYILFLSPCGGMCSTSESLINMLTDDTLLYDSITGKTNTLPLFDSTIPQNYSDTKTIGFYEPGDKYPDIMLQFENKLENGFLDMGLYKLPIQKDIFTFASNTQSTIKRKIENTMSGINHVSVQNINKYIKDKDKNLLLRRDNLLHKSISSYINHNLTPTFMLSKIIDSLNTSNRLDKHQLIIVNACRMSTSNNLCRQTRRLSLNQRKRNTY